MLIKDGKQSVEISDSNKPLVVDLFAKWGYNVETVIPRRGVLVDNVDDIISELSAWGIPWKKVYDEVPQDGMQPKQEETY